MWNITDLRLLVTSCLCDVRNSQVMLACVRTVYNLVDLLTTEQLWSWLPLVADAQLGGLAACRQVAHSIFMTVYSKYSGNTASQSVTNKLITCSREQLLLALSDPHPPNRLSQYINYATNAQSITTCCYFVQRTRLHMPVGPVNHLVVIF